MSKVVLDDALRAKLNGLNEHVELCDESGATVGHFLPSEDYKRLVLASLEIPISDDEIERRRDEKGGRTLAGIWKSLGQA